MARAANDMQTAVRMPTELYEQLRLAAGNRPVGEEIRRRLSASFTGEPTADDPKTRDLLAGIAYACGRINAEGSPWYESVEHWEALRTAVTMIMRQFRPAGIEPPPGVTEAQQRGVTLALRTFGYLDALSGHRGKP